MADAPPPTLPPGMDENKSWVPILTVVICLTVATLMVGLRIYTRGFITKQLGIDDYAAVFTLLVTYADGIVIAVSTRYGLGRHVMVLAPTDVMQYFKCFWLSVVLYCLGLLGAKMTFLFQYYRILAVQHMRIVYIIAIVIVGAWGLSQFLIGILMCRPIPAFWNPAAFPDASCIPNQPQFYINAAGNIATDVAVFLLPLPVIKQLNLPRTQKLLLIGVFSLGFFTVAISVIRIKFIGAQADPTWENVESSGWSIGELTSALTCACLPTLRPLFAKFFPSFRGSSARPSAPYHDHDSRESGRRRRLFHGAGHEADLLSSKDDIRGTVSERESGDGRQPSAHEHYEQQLGLKTMSKTEVMARYELGNGNDGDRYELGGDGQGAIQVRRDVHQTITRGGR